MILEAENWYLGYSQILADCRNHSEVAGTVGKTLILCNLDVDALSSARVLSYMLRCDGVPYQLLPCPTYSALERICRTNHVNNNSSSSGVCAIVLLNLGATRNLTKLLGDGQNNATTNTKIYVMDCRRPFHLANIHAGDNVVLFWDSTQNINEVPSDGDNLSAHDDTDTSSGSSSENNSSDDDDDDDDSQGTKEEEFLDDDDDDGNAENDNNHGQQDDAQEQLGKMNIQDHDNVEDDIHYDGDDDGMDADASPGSIRRRSALQEKQNKKRKKDKTNNYGTRDPLDDNNDNDSNNTNGNHDDDSSEDGRDDNDIDRNPYNTKKDKQRNTTTTMEDHHNPQDDSFMTATTAANTTQSSTSGSPSSLVDHEDEDDPIPTNNNNHASSSPTAMTVNIMTPREHYRQRREKLRLYYSDGTFFGSPAVFIAHRISTQLRFHENTDLLWLACVGLTDAYLHNRIDVSGYTELALELKRCALKLFPNDIYHRRINNAVYAEQLLGGTNNNPNENDTDNHNLNNNHKTRITFSENGRILAENDYRFFLLRHSSLYDSMVYSDYISTKFRLWTKPGIHKLQELLAKMGYPLTECYQPFAFMKPSLRRRLHQQILNHAEEYGLDDFEFTSFFRVTGYHSLLSASDTSYAVTALLECDTPSSSSSKTTKNQQDDDSKQRDSTEDDGTNDDNAIDTNNEEEEKLLHSFNVAYDALNSSSVPTVSLNGLTGGSNEGSSISNLVNGGNLSNNTSSGGSIGAGIRLAMKLQRCIISTAVNLMERNAITCLRHFRYAYITCTSQGENVHSNPGGMNNDARNNNNNSRYRNSHKRNNANTTTEESKNAAMYHIFAKPITLCKLAHYLMDCNRENGRWTGTKSRPLILMAENPARDTFLVVGYEYPERSGYFIKNRFGKNFELTTKTMQGNFQFDFFDNHVVEIHKHHVQRFIEQLHYLMDSI